MSRASRRGHGFEGASDFAPGVPAGRPGGSDGFDGASRDEYDEFGALRSRESPSMGHNHRSTPSS